MDLQHAQHFAHKSGGQLGPESETYEQVSKYQPAESKHHGEALSERFRKLWGRISFWKQMLELAGVSKPTDYESGVTIGRTSTVPGGSELNLTIKARTEEPDDESPVHITKKVIEAQWTCDGEELGPAERISDLQTIFDGANPENERILTLLEGSVAAIGDMKRAPSTPAEK